MSDPGNTPYDGEFVCKAKFRCLEKDDGEKDVWLNADPIAEGFGTIMFRSERCPHCGSNHWRDKEYYKKYA